jgi:hypothetical protein
LCLIAVLQFSKGAKIQYKENEGSSVREYKTSSSGVLTYVNFYTPWFGSLDFWQVEM